MEETVGMPGVVMMLPLPDNFILETKQNKFKNIMGQKIRKTT